METRKEKEAMLKDFMENPNNMSMWLPEFIGKGFNIPKTKIIPLTVEQVDWLLSDEYKEDDIKKFSDELKCEIGKLDFDTSKKFFIKTGNFSDKFVFENCTINNIDEIGKKFFSIFYDSMCVGCDICPELVIREFIETNYDRAGIYCGMKLNTEFRIFYDFENKKIVGLFNYWDREVMEKHLFDEELYSFRSSIDEIETDFNRLKEYLCNEITKNIDNVNLKGIYSIDFMWDGKKFWLIDAAIGSQSYYFNKINI